MTTQAIGPIVVLSLLFLGFVGYVWFHHSVDSSMTPADRERAAQAKQQGTQAGAGPVKNLGLVGAFINAQNKMAEQHAQMVCPHCQAKGTVTAHYVKRRRRLSVTRVVGAVATAGASLPLAGTSKKNLVTELHCSNCNMTWDI